MSHILAVNPREAQMEVLDQMPAAELYDHAIDDQSQVYIEYLSRLREMVMKNAHNPQAIADLGAVGRFIAIPWAFTHNLGCPWHGCTSGGGGRVIVSS